MALSKNSLKHQWISLVGKMNSTGGLVSNWILATGFWVDTKIWKDTEVWID